MSDAVFSLIKSGRWDELNRTTFLTVKYHNPENRIFQHFPVGEKINNPYKNNRLEDINILRIGIRRDTLTSVDIIEIVKCGGFFWRFIKSFSVITWIKVPIQNLLLICLKKEVYLDDKEKICFKTYLKNGIILLWW